MVNGVGSLISKEDDLALGPGLITQELLCSRVLLEQKKRKKPFDIDIRRGTEGVHLASLSKEAIYFFNWLLH